MTDRATRVVRVVPNGPVMVEGPVCIELPDGAVVESDRFMVAICTCRRSKNYPLCDTSHRRRQKPSSEGSDRSAGQANGAQPAQNSAAPNSAAQDSAAP
ncbi:CDGSH iron-sulfur domain-containing protein [Mycolicibacterium thermoresistibile]